MSKDAPLDSRAAQLIEALQLAPHPEGGFYRELYRSPATVTPDDGRKRRAALTTIYYLLPGGAHGCWHRVLSDEVWHHYEGDGLELLLAPPDASVVERLRLGVALASNGPVWTVPAGWWQAARPLGSYALAGCTVAPGFEFDDFTLLRDDARAMAALEHLSPELARLA